MKPDKQLDRHDLGLLQSVADLSGPDVELGAVLPEMLRPGTILLFPEVSNTSTDDGLAATFGFHNIGHAWTVTSDKDVELLDGEFPRYAM